MNAHLLRKIFSIIFFLPLIASAEYLPLGTYSTLYYNQQSTDLHGFELSFFPGSKERTVSVYIARLYQLYLVEIERSKDGIISFSVPANNGKEIFHFSLKCTVDSCAGEYEYEYAKTKTKEQIVLPRSIGYWNKGTNYWYWGSEKKASINALEQASIIRAGTTYLALKSKTGMATVEIKTVDLKEEDLLVYGQYTKSPSRINLLNITIDDQPIVVPRSVFSDLIDPHKASIEFKNNQYVLSINGGDGAESYFVHIYFESRKGIVRRSVYSSLAPASFYSSSTINKPTQETHYFSRALEEE